MSQSTSPAPPGPPSDVLAEVLDGENPEVTVPSKKKKKKKTKKSKAANANASSKTNATPAKEEAEAPPVLCINRNKHWKYISSYHGPWLQLPIELLESLLLLNLDPATMSPTERRFPSLTPPSPVNRIRERSPPRFGDRRDGAISPPLESPYSVQDTFAIPPSIPMPEPGQPAPPPIDPGVFRCVASIRRLVDEAAELAVRASSGLSAAALGSLRSGDFGGGGRQTPMSANRIHRLRLLAVQKLAAAYKADEIASSVMVMQGGSVFDDIADKVLKVEPHNADARYVHFFHEKIPSRQLAESTTTDTLDHLIKIHPQRLEFYRTRGIVHCFRSEFPQAVKDFTFALKEARAQRKARSAHASFNTPPERRKGKKKKSKDAGQSSNDSKLMIQGPDGEELYLHPSALADAPDPIEPQLLFNRGIAYLSNAVYIIEEEMLKLEGLPRHTLGDGTDFRLCHLKGGKFGGTEIGDPGGPLGPKEGTKFRAYAAVLAEPHFKEHLYSLLKKCIRDLEKFLSHFDTLEVPDQGDPLDFRLEQAFLLCESLRPGSRSGSAPSPSPTLSNTPLSFTTYHPLLVEAHFSVLLCKLLLGEFGPLLTAFPRVASLVAGLEGYPVFLPPRSMAQAEFVEVLERLAEGWRHGAIPPAIQDVTQVLPAENIDADADQEIASMSSSQTLLDDESILEASSSRSSGPSTAVSVAGIKTPTHSGRVTPTSADVEADADTDVDSSTATSTTPGRTELLQSLDAMRALLAPIIRRQHERKEALIKPNGKAKGKAKTGEKEKEKGSERPRKPMSINVSLHGPRVEIFLAWLDAVHLADLEEAAK